MATWDGNKVDKSNINNGNQFGQEGIAYEDINAVVNNSIYASNFADHLADTPDTSQAGTVGTPSVTLINNVVGGITYKKFKFSNLKGQKGDKGDKGDKGIIVNNGGSTTYNTVSFTLSGTTLTITTSA